MKVDWSQYETDLLSSIRLAILMPVDSFIPVRLCSAEVRATLPRHHALLKDCEKALRTSASAQPNYSGVQSLIPSDTKLES